LSIETETISNLKLILFSISFREKQVSELKLIGHTIL